MDTTEEARWERRLALWLRLCALLVGLAFLAVVMPTAWMAATHEAIGLGPFPPGPIVPYLARSTSAFYGMFGVLMWIVANDLRRHAPVLRLLLWASLGFGLAIIPIDITSGLPTPWCACEGPMVLALTGLLALATKRSGVLRG